MTADDLTHRAIIAAHDAECVCGSERYGDHRGLTEAEQAIVGAWRADVAEKSAEIDDKSRVGHAAADAWMDKAHQAEAALERVRALGNNWLRLSSEAMDQDVRQWTRSAGHSVLAALDRTEATHGG